MTPPPQRTKPKFHFIVSNKSKETCNHSNGLDTNHDDRGVFWVMKYIGEYLSERWSWSQTAQKRVYSRNSGDHLETVFDDYMSKWCEMWVILVLIGSDFDLGILWEAVCGRSTNWSKISIEAGVFLL